MYHLFKLVLCKNVCIYFCEIGVRVKTKKLLNKIITMSKLPTITGWLPWNFMHKSPVGKTESVSERVSVLPR